MDSPEATGRRRRRRVRLVLGALAAGAVVLLAVGLGSSTLRPENPPASPPASEPLPISTGGGVAPSGPGQTPTIAADSVPFSRPEFTFEGSRHWQIHESPGGGKVLEGYASRPSYLPGETLRLAVSTSAPTYAFSIWRVSGRGPFESPFVHVTSRSHLSGTLQAAPTVDPVTKVVAANWQYGVSLRIPRTWPSGVYLVRLASSEHVQSYIPFVVRSPRAHAILVVSNALDWEAYNTWGGSSVYMTRVGEPVPDVHRALGVSFDRPYAADGGAGQLFFLELPLISWLERQGLDLAYTTDYDLSLHSEAQPLPKVVVFNGHGEYWGVPLYDWLDRHVTAGDLGVGLFAADTGYWPISFGRPSADGPRTFLCFKDGPVPAALLPAGQSPEPSERPGATPPPGDVEERSGAGFQALGPGGPYVGSFAGEPLFGVRYRGITASLGRYSLDPSAADPRLLDGTGLSAGSSLGFIAGGEVDGIYPSAEWWGPEGGAYDHRFAVAVDVPGRVAATSWTAEAVWRELPSGGRVFSAGTFYWGWALDPAWGSLYGVPPGFGRLTLNILRFLGATDTSTNRPERGPRR